eukprot:5110960-Amphidinium_carterae.5
MIIARHGWIARQLDFACAFRQGRPVQRLLLVLQPEGVLGDGNAVAVVMLREEAMTKQMSMGQEMFDSMMGDEVSEETRTWVRNYGTSRSADIPEH